MTPSPTLDARLDAYLGEQRKELHLPGIELAVVRDDKIEHLAAVGTAGEGRPLTPQTPVLIASLSKSLTAVAVMQLVEKGELALDAPVVRYLPWFTTTDQALSAKLTVADLLHQTSGLPEHSTSDADTTTDHSAAALENGVRAMRKMQLMHAPGGAFGYSNANYQILGLLVQTVSGQPFAQYMAQHVFEPAGMRHTFAERGPAVAAGVSAAYYRWYGLAYRPTPSIPEPPSLAPAAMMWSSAEDLAHHLILNMNGGSVGGGSVLSPAAVAQMHRPAAEVNNANAYTMGWYMRPTWEQSTTKTFSRGDYELPFVWEHGGSSSTASTYLGFIPSEHLGIVLLINGNNPPAESALGNIHINVWHILAGTPTERVRPDEPLLLRFGSLVALGVLALLAVSLVWSLRELRRLRAGPTVGRRRRWLALALPLLIDLAVLCFLWLYLPAHFVATVPSIVRGSPDIGLVIILATLLAAGWGSARTALFVKAATRTTSGVENKSASPRTRAPLR